MDKEKQPLILDPELGTKNHETSVNMGRWSEGYIDPSYGTVQKAKVSAKTKPEKVTVLAMPKPDTSSESEIPGLWNSSFNREYCCIYRVPNRLRKVNPEAYTPQMVLIGPLHHSEKSEVQLAKTDLRYLEYMNMELHKKRYLEQIAKQYGVETIEEFKKIIERDEKFIRESYAESTNGIKSQEFQEMILHDAVFILGLFIKTESTLNINNEDDILFQEPCFVNTILEDLMLLENQLPYALLENLFESLSLKLEAKVTLRDIVLRAFKLEGRIKEEVKFRHFTDLFRRVRVETLDLSEEEISRVKTNRLESIKSLHNADKLDSAGVKFANVDEENDLSLVIDFERGSLKMPCFIAEDNTERVMRNLMALEQCHYPLTAFVCNYITFLDFLIDTEQDVDLLVKKEVIKNWLGHQRSVSEMVNKLCLGLVDFGSYYHPISVKLNKHYDSNLNRSRATLRRVYFKDIWTGTATVAAAILLVLTFIQTVASVLQVTGHKKSPAPAPAPAPAPSKQNFEKQPLMVDLEQGTKNNETRSGTVQKAKVLDTKKPEKATVWAMPKPNSGSEYKIPGLWNSSINQEYCCIYRVPNQLRKVNPEAYIPQMLLIGPIHHSMKAEANLSMTDSRYLEYLNMDLHKKRYLEQITNEYGVETVQEFKKIIERDEIFIRESYAESTDWIESQEFQEMILHDAVFILVFFIKIEATLNINNKDDILFQTPCLIKTILGDLMLLENQLPYTILENLFYHLSLKLGTKVTLRDIVLKAFKLERKLKDEVKFLHFTDLFRRVRVETLGLTEEEISRVKGKQLESIKSLHNADKLDCAGVKFANGYEGNELSLVISFKVGILRMPCFTADDNTERVMRNIMALEQCHYPLTAFVCNYITFLNVLIDTDEDVDLLIGKGVVKNRLGHQRSVAEMVNKLCLGLVDFGSYYHPISEAINEHYKSNFNRSMATLRRVFFKDLWTGTATLHAVFSLLVLTLIQTVASVIQVMQSNK